MVQLKLEKACTYKRNVFKRQKKNHECYVGFHNCDAFAVRQIQRKTQIRCTINHFTER